MAHISLTIKKSIIFCVVITFFTLFIAVFSFFVLKNKSLLLDSPDRLLWFIFAFISGIFMIGTRSVYPVALSISSVKAKTKRSYTTLKIIVFSITTAFILSLFGALLPQISSLPLFDVFDFNQIKNQLYVLFGLFAYVISLSNLNVINLGGIVLVKNIKDVLKAPSGLTGILVLTLVSFFCEIIPSTWLLFLEAGLSQDVTFGIMLILAHLIGRTFFISMVSALSRFGIDTTSWLMDKKDSIKNGLSVITIVFSSIIIQIGLFNLAVLLRGDNSHIVKIIEDGWVFLLLLTLPLWISFFKEEDRVYGSGESDIHSIKAKIRDLEGESQVLQVVNKHNNKGILKQITRLISKIEELEYISKILESSLRHGSKTRLRSNVAQLSEERELKKRLIATIFITIFAITFISVFMAS